MRSPRPRIGSRTVKTRSATSAPGTATMKKTERQPTASASTPPRATPTGQAHVVAGPLQAVRLAAARAGVVVGEQAGGRRVVELAGGAEQDPADEEERERRRDAAEHRARRPRRARPAPTIAVRRPVSASRPAGSSRTTPATAAAVGIAPARVSPKSKWSWIAGSAPATRLNSTRSMNATSAITIAGHQPNGAARLRSTVHRRRGRRRPRPPAGAVTDPSRVASDIRPAPMVRGTGVRGLGRA